ncbi:MAG: hypothetical protein E7244_04220 [Enterocloster citroniae]|nr:hypothetical protein [Enterocloster citroniae]
MKILTQEEQREFVDTETGEVFQASLIIKNDDDFYKVFLRDLCGLYGLTQNRQVDVINYILTNMNDKTNLLNASYDEISKAIGVSKTTVKEVFSKLIKARAITRIRNAVYMVNPAILSKGKAGKQYKLMIIYNGCREGGNDDN